jgi:hypothetical protein
MGFKIPEPPKDTFTPAEWAAILARRAERAATGTKQVGE